LSFWSSIAEVVGQKEHETRINRVNADVLAESRRLAFDVSNAAEDGMPSAPEDGALHEAAGQQRSDARDRRQRKDPGRMGDLANAADT